MAYHTFPNLQSIFPADLGRKVMSGVTSADFTDSDCNCRQSILQISKEYVNREISTMVLQAIKSSSARSLSQPNQSESFRFHRIPFTAFPWLYLTCALLVNVLADLIKSTPS